MHELIIRARAHDLRRRRIASHAMSRRRSDLLVKLTPRTSAHLRWLAPLVRGDGLDDEDVDALRALSYRVQKSQKVSIHRKTEEEAAKKKADKERAKRALHGCVSRVNNAVQGYYESVDDAAADMEGDFNAALITKLLEGFSDQSAGRQIQLDDLNTWFKTTVDYRDPDLEETPGSDSDDELDGGGKSHDPKDLAEAVMSPMVTGRDRLLEIYNSFVAITAPQHNRIIVLEEELMTSQNLVTDQQKQLRCLQEEMVSVTANLKAKQDSQERRAKQQEVQLRETNKRAQDLSLRLETEQVLVAELRPQLAQLQDELQATKASKEAEGHAAIAVAKANQDLAVQNAKNQVGAYYTNIFQVGTTCT